MAIVLDSYALIDSAAIMRRSSLGSAKNFEKNFGRPVGDSSEVQDAIVAEPNKLCKFQGGFSEHFRCGPALFLFSP